MAGAVRAVTRRRATSAPAALPTMVWDERPASGVIDGSPRRTRRRQAVIGIGRLGVKTLAFGVGCLSWCLACSLALAIPNYFLTYWANALLGGPQGIPVELWLTTTVGLGTLVGAILWVGTVWSDRESWKEWLSNW